MKCFPYYSGNIVNIVKEVTSAYEPSGRSLSRFPQYEATRNIFTSHYGVLVHRRVTASIKFVSCPRTQRNVPGQVSNPDRSIQSRVH